MSSGPTTGQHQNRVTASRGSTREQEAEEAKKREEVQKKLKSSGNGPEFAVRKTRELDKMIKRLVTKRSKTSERIAEDKHKLALLDKRRAEVDKRYNDVLRRLADRQQLRERIQKQLDESTSQFSALLGTTFQRERRARFTQYEFKRREAEEELTAARGFTANRFAGLRGDPSKMPSWEKQAKMRRGGHSTGDPLRQTAGASAEARLGGTGGRKAPAAGHRARGGR